jgi:outer membrane protein assembly factor BamB
MVDDSIESASFESSATITTHPLLANVTGVFVGATVHYPSPTPVAGRLYALNSNGAMQWMFPAAGGHPIRPVTSSPALGSGNVLYLTTDDGLLLAVSPSGAELWRHQLSVPVPTSGLAPSPMTSASNVYAASTQGMTAALTLDGQIVWAQMEDDAFASSLALGAQIALTPTSTPAGAATATPQANVTSTPTPSPTPTAVSQVSTIFGVTRSGVLVVRNAADGTQLPPSGPLPTPVDGDVVSSPALSFDNFLVFGTSTGMLYVVNTATGLPATGWPVAVTNGMAIRSSPSIGNDGTIYVGADDGQLHAIGNK